MAYKVETAENQGLQSNASAHSRYALFLIEQLIVILIFALCAAICVKIFTDSYLMAQNSNDVNCALIAAENGAEVFKAVGEDAASMAKLLNGVSRGGDVVVYYDSSWDAVSQNDAVYIMTLDVNPTNGVLVNCLVSVDKINGDNILEFNTALRK